VIRICYTVDAPFLGGAEMYVARLATALDRREFRATVLMHEPVRDARLGAWADDLRAHGIAVRTVPMRLPFVPWDALRQYRILDAISPHIVHVNMPGPYDGQCGLMLAVARAAGAHTVVTEHLPMVARLWKRAFVKRIAYRSLDAAITLTQANARFVVGRQGVRGERVHVIPNGIARSFGAPAGAKTRRWELGLRDSHLALVYIGNILPHKGLRRLIEAVSRCETRAHVQLLVVGAGSDEAACRQLASDRGLAGQVRFFGWCGAEQTEEILAAGDALALPSEIEGLPYVLLEAMACVRPVIAGNVFGIPEVVDDGVTGLLVDPLDIGAIAAAVDRLADASLRRAMGAAARERFETHFTLAEQAQRMQALYRSLLSGARAGAPS